MTSTEWSLASNWTAGVPDPTDFVTITNVSNSPVIMAGTAAEAIGVLVEAGATLNISADASLTIGASSPTQIGIENKGMTVNFGLIVMGGSETIGSDGIYNKGTFKNMTGGQIRIDRTSRDGIDNLQDAVFENAGLIVMGSSKTLGTDGIYNKGTFKNMTGGQIRIDRTSRDGIDNLQDAVFENVGLIVIGGSETIGSDGIYNLGTFKNMTGGQIRIDRTSRDGIDNLQDAFFENSGLIEIGLTVSSSGIGLYQAASFTNSACGRIYLTDAFFNSSSFTNAGFLTVDTEQVHTNSVPFTNTGLMVYPQDNPIPNVTNSGLIVAPITGCSPSVSPALQVGGANGFTTATTWYKDAYLTMIAGTYDTSLNKFTATHLAPGTTTRLYFAATDIANACTDTVSITVTLNALPTVNAGPDQLVSLGFGGPNSNCTNLTATPSGGSGGGYAFTWNPGSVSGQTLNVCPQQTTNYTVTVTDGNGCTASDQVTVRVQDVRCGSGGVKMCLGGRQICLAPYLVPTYQRFGATLGECSSQAPARIAYEQAQTEGVPFGLSLQAFPNPVQDAVTVRVLSASAGEGTFEVQDMAGRLRQSRKQVLVAGLNEVEFRLGSLPTGVYLIKSVDALGLQGVVRVSKE